MSLRADVGKGSCIAGKTAMAGKVNGAVGLDISRLVIAYVEGSCALEDLHAHGMTDHWGVLGTGKISGIR